MFNVTISEKGGQQSEYSFSKPEITIGRMKGNDIVLPKGNVSKQHTRLFMRDGNFFIVDLKSTNGTYVNGRKVTSEQQISESDTIYIGDFILQISRQQQQQDAPPQPPAQQSGGNAAGSSQDGGRHFPTVMEGAQSRDAVPPSPGTQQSQSSQHATQRSMSPSHQSSPGDAQDPSSPGNLSSPGSQPSPDNHAKPADHSSSAALSGAGGSRSDTPMPDDGQDLRKTYGDSSPHPSAVGDEPDIEPIDDDIEPIDDDIEPIDDDIDVVEQEPVDGTDSPPPSAPTGGSGGSRTRTAASSPDDAPQPRGGDRSSNLDITSQLREPGSDRRSRPSEPAPGEQKTSTTGATGALTPPRELASEFDDNFHRAHQDAARAFLDSTPVDELPVEYPLEDNSQQLRLGKAVGDAVEALNPDVDDKKLVQALKREVTGLGVVDRYLDDDSVREIYVNTQDHVVLRRNGDLVVAEQGYSHPDFLELAARRLLSNTDHDRPSGEIRLDDGTRIHVLRPPAAVDGSVITVQKPNRYFPALGELLDDGVLSPGMAEFLEHAVEAGRSMIIAGPTGSGKSTLMAALSKVVPSASRVVVIEQHASLPMERPNFVRLEAGTDYGMRQLVRDAVAMYPERILVDGCRGAEAYEWVTAATSGTEGSMLSLHGINAVDALGRLGSFCLLGTDDLSPRGLREQIAHCVDLVVVLNTTSERGFRIQQIAEVQGVDLDSYRLNDIFYYRVEGTAGDFHPTGYIPLFYEDLRHAGLDVDLDIFRE